MLLGRLVIAADDLGYCQKKGLERKAAVIAKLPGLTG
jgi:hypothetical protein